MTEAFVLGIDLGTSAVKALAVAPDGRVLGRGSASYGIEWIREGWAEQDPDTWWTASVEAVREALAAARRAGGAKVTAVGLSGQVNGVVLTDRRRRPLGHALIWLDQRAAVEAQEINAGAGDLLLQTALGTAGPIHAGAKLRWLQRHDPERFRATWKALFPKDFLTLRLTGEAVTDVTDAGASLLLDLRRRTWAGVLLDRIGIPRSILPEVVESPTVVGGITADAAAQLGIPEGTPVVAGAGDMAAITAGTGVIVPGLGCAIIGTAGQVAVFTPACPSVCPPGAWAMTHPMPGAYFWHGLVMTAGYALTWLSDLVASGSDVGRLIDLARGSPPGSRGLLFLPYLDGVASPHADPAARGAFIGAASTHRLGDFTRAVMEGVAFNFRETFEIFTGLGESLSRVRIGGGGSRGDLWPSIMADVLGVELDILEEIDASAFGAALIAAVGTRTFPDFFAAAAAMVRVSARVSPSATRRDLYEECYAAYRQAYSRTRELTHMLGSLGQRHAPVP